MYHFATMFWPSGLIDGHSIRITLSKIGLIFGIVRVRQEVVRELQSVLAARNLGRVQPAVDVDERLSLLSKTMRLGIGQPVGMRETLRDLAILLDVGQVLRARHEGEVPRMPVRRPVQFRSV